MIEKRIALKKKKKKKPSLITSFGCSHLFAAVNLVDKMTEKQQDDLAVTIGQKKITRNQHASPRYGCFLDSEIEKQQRSFPKGEFALS